jgi:hypothetical protein
MLYSNSSKDGKFVKYDIKSKERVGEIDLNIFSQQNNIPLEKIYNRGIASDENHIFIGANKFIADRASRESDVYIFQIDKKRFEVNNWIKHEKLGALNDIRMINKKDLACYNPHKFPIKI